MKFTSKTKAELAAGNLWAKGDYAFEIMEAEDAISSKDNDMIKLKVKLVNDNGKTQVLFDYLGEWNLYKVQPLCELAGLTAEYEAGDLDAYGLVGVTGQCKVGVSIDKTGEYDDKNDIKKFYVDTPASKKTLDETLGDDAIDFE